MPHLSENGKTVKLWIHKCPKAAEFDHVVFPGVCLDQHRNEENGQDFESKISQYEAAAEECKHQAGTGDVNELLLHLPFECDQKGFLEPVSSDPSKAIQLLMTKVPNPDNDEKMYPVCMHWKLLRNQLLMSQLLKRTQAVHVKPRHGWRCRRLCKALARQKMLVLLHLLLQITAGSMDKDNGYIHNDS